MNSKQIEKSIENALKERQDLSPEFVNQLEEKLKSLKNGVINK